jgi:hypothetical protein
MKRKILIVFCCVLLVCAFSGCQLAKESAGTNAYEDRLIGVFITTEYLDLFDFDGYFNDNSKGFQGGEIVMDEKNTQQYQGRLYAVLIPRTSTNEETGENIVTHEYVFEGIEGISYCVPMIEAAEDENSYIATTSDPAISDPHTDLHYGDDENRISLDGTIYVTSSNVKHTYYFNPVYQSADGSVYASTGNGFMVDSDEYSEGSAYSHTMDSVTTITENGKTKKDSIYINVSISVMFAPEKTVILQMDTNNALISRTEYKPDTLPDVITPEKSTAYFIVENYKRDDTGILKISREIYGRDVENIETFFVRPDGVCIKQGTQIM